MEGDVCEELIMMMIDVCCLHEEIWRGQDSVDEGKEI